MSQARARLGVLGGSFDPPHYGHLALAETARVQLHLDGVLFVPAGQPPHKRDRALSAPEHRAAMVQVAIADNAAFQLSRVDLDRSGPHYTADLLSLLPARYTRVTEWYFLMGEDALADLPTWYRPEAIVRLAHLAVMPRTGQRVEAAALYEALPLLKGRLVWLDVPPVDFAATDLRRRARVGLPLRYLVPPGVRQYIVKHSLYG